MCPLIVTIVDDSVKLGYPRPPDQIVKWQIKYSQWQVSHNHRSRLKTVEDSHSRWQLQLVGVCDSVVTTGQHAHANIGNIYLAFIFNNSFFILFSYHCQFKISVIIIILLSVEMMKKANVVLICWPSTINHQCNGSMVNGSPKWMDHDWIKFSHETIL